MASESPSALLLRSRFFHYSKRVQTLILPPRIRSDEPERTPKWATREGLYERVHVDHSVLRAWQRAQAVLFPKLHGLDLDFRDSDAECTAIMWSFLAPAITDVRLNTDEQSAAILSADALEALAERCTHITRFTSYSHCQAQAEQVRVTSRLLCASAVLRYVHVPHVITPAAVMHLSACPNLRSTRIHHDAASPRFTPSFSAHSFPALERIHINDQQHGSRLVHDFVSSQATCTFRDVQFWAHMPVSAWMDVIRRLSLHTRLTHVFLRLGYVHLHWPDSDVLSSLADLIAPLTTLPLLESVQVKPDVQGLTSAMSEAEVLRMFSQWPQLRCWMVPTEQISLATFVRLLELCPQLGSMSAVLSCVALPTEDAVARAELLDHPYEHVITLAPAQCPSLKAVALIIARTFPRVAYVQYVQPAFGASFGYYEEHKHLTKLIRRFARQRSTRRPSGRV
jgi:hypothetical protein